MIQIRPAAPGKPCNRNGCRVLSFFDEGVKQAAAMPVATVHDEMLVAEQNA